MADTEPDATPDWQAYIDAVAPALGLEVPAEARGEVARFLALAAEARAALAAADLPDDDLALAPVFSPGEPGAQEP